MTWLLLQIISDRTYKMNLVALNTRNLPWNTTGSHIPEAEKLTDANLSTFGSIQPSGMRKSREKIDYN